MTEPAPDTAAMPPGPLLPPPPALPSQHESLTARIGGWIRHAEADAPAVTADLKAAFRDHAGQVFDLAGDLVKLESPEAAALMPRIFALVEDAARLAGALHG